jgi:hypothetical protein
VDFNAEHPRWCFNQPNTRSQTLNKFILDHNLKIFPLLALHIGSHMPTNILTFWTFLSLRSPVI